MCLKVYECVAGRFGGSITVVLNYISSRRLQTRMGCKKKKKKFPEMHANISRCKDVGSVCCLNRSWSPAVCWEHIWLQGDKVCAQVQPACCCPTEGWSVCSVWAHSYFHPCVYLKTKSIILSGARNLLFFRFISKDLEQNQIFFLMIAPHFWISFSVKLKLFPVILEITYFSAVQTKMYTFTAFTEMKQFY